jgi:ATP-binding cassette subfamily B protein
LLKSYVAASWQLQAQDLEGHFQELMTNQIAQASTGSVQMTLLITSGCTFGILVVSAFALNFFAALTVFAAAIMLFVALRPLNSLGARMARQTSASQLDYAGSVGEANRMTEEAGVFGVLRPLSERVDGFISVARTSYMRTQIIARAVPNIYQSMIYIVLVVGLLAVTIAHLHGFSTLGAVVLLLVRAGTYGQQLQTSYVLVRQAMPYVDRLDDARNAYLAGAPQRGDAPLGEIETISFDSVSYSYRPDRRVLKDLSFVIKGGETVGVVGPSGAGKSTILQVLLRLRQPTSGRFLVNGTEAHDLAFADWHDRVSYVPQQPKLLHASVADNVRFFRDFDQASVERACKLARIHNEILSWPSGYETIVGPRADAVSGGQQQRICLARALVSNPSLLILDEPTSALDPRSESLIQQSLEALRDRLTLIIIAHRMSTLTICDRIMVVLDGSLDAFAGLQELETSNHYYRYASGLESPPEPGAPDVGAAANHDVDAAESPQSSGP